MMNPFKTKRGLGRGLSSLIGDTKIATTKKLATTYIGTVIYMSVLFKFHSIFNFLIA